LTPDERAAIAGKLKPASYEAGEALVQPGDVLQSLFIVGSGVLSVTRTNTVGDKDEMRFGPGDYFGEIGLLTGAPAGGNIIALAPSVVYELAKADLRPTLEARPQIAQELGRAMAERLGTGRTLSPGDLDTTVAAKGLSAWLSQRMHRLFELNSAD
jgi:CRP-like cAMP-binding protein